ncbi:hypothetical protein SAMN06295905_1647 [Devosia lucknowensis]|uniref:Uncharacterized protein n=1 Tax=Devosia lucknowensis TaxID=1096929 RepID=A0A1Y6F8M6_9HYPH|nr:hypothetical protein [Devosia lucknowensis]SMQ68743.1 hypothetical protein SAMN06295905_1647 [Devosia lucknowensis]
MNISGADLQNQSTWRVISDTATLLRPGVGASGSSAVPAAESDPAVKKTIGAPEGEGLTALHSEAELEARRPQFQAMLLLSAAERRNPEGATALREALANGTVKTQKASDVPGVNYKSSETRTYDANGKLTYQKVGTEYFRPSPEIQAIIDAGRGAAMWQSGVGDVWVTW